MDTFSADFEQQLDTFLHLAGRKAFGNPTPEAFAHWFVQAVPKVLPAFIEQIPPDPAEVERTVAVAVRMPGGQGRVQGSTPEVIPGALDTRKVMPFWRAVLGYEPRPDSPEEDLVDPQDRGPGFWFERMTEPRGDGGGAIHLAVWVPYEQARSRIDAALAAGGRLVRDEFAPAWWTLADPAGNEVDIATITATESGRD